MIKIIIIAGVIIWLGASLYAALRKDKMLAVVLFFSIPVGVMFILVMVMIVLVSLKLPIK